MSNPLRKPFKLSHYERNDWSGFDGQAMIRAQAAWDSHKHAETVYYDVLASDLAALVAEALAPLAKFCTVEQRRLAAFGGDMKQCRDIVVLPGPDELRSFS